MMDELLKKMKDYSRFLELEDNIPYWESLMPELEDRIEELNWNKQQKELEMLQLKEPNFFQRLFGRAELWLSPPCRSVVLSLLHGVTQPMLVTSLLTAWVAAQSK